MTHLWIARKRFLAGWILFVAAAVCSGSAAAAEAPKSRACTEKEVVGVWDAILLSDDPALLENRPRFEKVEFDAFGRMRWIASSQPSMNNPGAEAALQKTLSQFGYKLNPDGQMLFTVDGVPKEGLLCTYMDGDFAQGKLKQGDIILTVIGQDGKPLMTKHMRKQKDSTSNLAVSPGIREQAKVPQDSPQPAFPQRQRKDTSERFEEQRKKTLQKIEDEYKSGKRSKENYEAAIKFFKESYAEADKVMKESAEKNEKMLAAAEKQWADMNRAASTGAPTTVREASAPTPAPAPTASSATSAPAPASPSVPVSASVAADSDFVVLSPEHFNNLVYAVPSPPFKVQAPKSWYLAKKHEHVGGPDRAVFTRENPEETLKNGGHYRTLKTPYIFIVVEPNANRLSPFALSEYLVKQYDKPENKVLIKEIVKINGREVCHFSIQNTKAPDQVMESYYFATDQMVAQVVGVRKSPADAKVLEKALQESLQSVNLESIL